MKKAKRIYILLGVLAAIIVAILVVSRYQSHVEQIQNTKEVILDIDSEEVTALSWDAEGYSYAFYQDDGWKYEEDENFPVSEEKLDELLDIFSNFEAEFEIENVSDYGQYGLKDPVATIRLTLTDGTTREITLGDFSVLDAERYLCLDGGTVYLVETDPLESFELELIDLMQQDELDSITQATSLTFSGQEEYSVYYEEESDLSYNPEDVYFVSGSDQPLDTANVQSYLTSLCGISLYDYATYDATDEELEKYGFNSPVLTVTVAYAAEDEDGEEIAKDVTLTVAENQEELAAIEDGEDDTEVSKYVRVDDSSILYNLSETDYETLTAASYNDLRHADVLSVDFTEVYQVDITLEDTEYILYAGEGSAEDEAAEEEDAEAAYAAEADEDDAYSADEDAGDTYAEDEESERAETLADYFYYYYGGEPIEAADLGEGEEMADYRTGISISEFSGLVSGITAETFTEEQPTDREEIGLTVHLDNERYPEVTLHLYRYDGSTCLAVLDGEPVALVGRAAVTDLVEAVYGMVLS